MGAWLLVLFALAGTPAHAGSWVYGSYTNAWGTRGFQLWVPDGYVPGQRLPLVVGLHGCLQNPDQFAGLTRLNQKADAEKFLVLYPNQATSANGSQCWNFMLASNQERGLGEPSIIVGPAHQCGVHVRLLEASQCPDDGLYDGLSVVIIPRLLSGKLLLQEPGTGRATKLTQTEGRGLTYSRIRLLQHGFQQGPRPAGLLTHP